MRSLGVDGLKVHLLELGDLGGLDLVEVASDTGVENAGLLLDGHRDVLLLLEELGELLTSVKELLGGGIQIRTELGEGSDLTILSELELEGTGELFHGLNLGGRTDTRHGKTDIDSGTDTLMEELGLEEDLTIGNGDDISGDIGGHITSLGLNDGEGGEGSSTVVLVHLSCALKETRVKIEDITWVSLTTGRSSEEEGHLTVSDSLLGEIVVDDESVLSVITEVLTDGASRVRSQELEGSGIGGGSSDDNRVFHAISVVEKAHNVGNSGSLLSNGDVDAVKRLGVVTSLEDGLLVNNSVDGDSGLTGLSITNDQFTLASANGHERVDRLETSLHRFVHGFSRNNTWGFQLDSSTFVSDDRASAINGVTKRVNNSAEHTLSNGDINDRSCSLDNITFLDFSVKSNKERLLDTTHLKLTAKFRHAFIVLKILAE